MILSGTPVAHAILQQVQKKVETLREPPGLAVILVGNNPASSTYVNMKRQACINAGIRSFFDHLPEDATEDDLLACINRLNNAYEVDGILVQSPLPYPLKLDKIIETLSPEKDVDGFHPINMGKLLLGRQDGLIPCTPLGIQALLKHYQIPIIGKHVVIVGRSTIVGRPLAALFMQNSPEANATVTVCHSKSSYLKEITRTADILVAAVGIPRFITEDFVAEKTVVIDVGINRESDPSSSKGYKLVGDVDFEAVQKKCMAITPVPKGVGPLTVAMLLQNTLLSYQRRRG